MNHADYNRLHAVNLLRAYTDGEMLSASEAITRLATNPMWQATNPNRERMVAGARHIQDLAAIIRTGGLFVFARDDIPPPTEDHHHPEYLPPLPFPRLWIEIANTKDTDLTYRDFDGNLAQAIGFAIVEVEPYKDWRILMPMWDYDLAREKVAEAIKEYPRIADAVFDSYKLTCCREWHLLHDPEVGKVGISMAETELKKHRELVANGTISRQEAAIANSLASFPEVLINLLHTLGVVHEQLEAPRPRRREFKRRYGVEHPNLYWVHVRSTNEPHPGKGDREYRHRWLVRGHYRKHHAGNHNVPGKGICTWVRPYVKGPEGAPWKGRPVYTTVAQDAA